VDSANYDLIRYLSRVLDRYWRHAHQRNRLGQ
jgi:hypothetical protein